MVSVDLTWTDNSDNEDGFEIFRGTTSGSLSSITTVGANTTTYTDTNAPRDTVYYRVEAYTEHTSASSSEQSIDTTWNITIDGTSVKSITIDGTEVKNLTIDGTNVE